MRRVLLITSDFPPVAGTNVQRVLKFAKYLPQFGWMPIVLTQRVIGPGAGDPSHLEELDSRVQVVRSGSLDPFAWVARRGNMSAIKGEDGPTPHAPTSKSVGASAGDREASGAPARSVPSLRRALLGPPSRALQALLRQFCYIPDPLMMWVLPAFFDGLAVVRRQRPAVLVSSCPSFSSHVLGLLLARATRLPWIADFRDLWVGRPYRRVLSPLHAAGNASLERRVVSRCDRLVICAPEWRETFRGRYGEDTARKIRYIPNGYDPEDAQTQSARTQDGWLRFVYTGGIYTAASPAPLLSALGYLVRDDPVTFRRVRLVLAGPSEESERASLLDLARELHLTEHLEFRGVVAHREALALQAGADVLVLSLAPGHRHTISGKGFEYMASRKPILALVPLDGTQAAILQRSGLGICVEHGDVEGTVEALRRIVTDLIHGVASVAPDLDYIQQYDRRRLTEALASVLNEVIPEGSEG